MNRIDLRTILRSLIVLVIQVVLLKRIDLSIGSFNYIHLFLYPTLIMFLPIKTPRVLLLILALAFGLVIDVFYDSIGVHASALVFMAYSKKFVLQLLEPVEGYNVDQSLSFNKMGFLWVISFTAILLFLHLAWYFSVEAFSFVYFKDIIFRTLSSFVASFVLIALFLLIYNPKN